MTIASQRSSRSHGSSLRRRILHSLLVTASALAGCRSSQQLTPVASAPTKPTTTESQFAWGALEQGSGQTERKTIAHSAKGEIALVSTSAAFPLLGSVAGAPNDLPPLKPISVQSTDPNAQRSLTPAPQSSTGSAPAAPPASAINVAGPSPTAYPVPAPVPMPTVLGTPFIDAAGVPVVSGDECISCCGLTRNFGVSTDQCGWQDNISARVGGTLSAINDYATQGGGVAILESTKQLWRSNWFVHSGVATEVLDDHWMVSVTAGMSRLARIRGDEVCEPWILAATYDGYWDPSIFGTGDTMYADQLRILTGFALRPRWDVGAWGAIGGRRDHGLVTVPVVGATPATFRASRYFANRVAGYSSFDLNDRGAQLITSAGWEDSPGQFFFEADGFIPVRRNVNLFVGMGYSANGSWDGVAGVELLNGSATKQRRPSTGCWGADSCAFEAAVDCGDRYRGGWANGVYRSALRVLTPSRERRYLANEYALVTPPTIVPPPAVIVPGAPPAPAPGPAPVPAPIPAPVPVPVPVPVDPPPPNNPPPPVNPPPPTPTEICPPRLPGHTQIDGRLSQWLRDHATAHQH
jgi:hypothetical protein